MIDPEFDSVDGVPAEDPRVESLFRLDRTVRFVVLPILALLAIVVVAFVAQG